MSVIFSLIEYNGLAVVESDFAHSAIFHSKHKLRTEG